MCSTYWRDCVRDHRPPSSIPHSPSTTHPSPIPSATTVCVRRPPMADIVAELKALKLHGMAAGYADLLQNGGTATIGASEWLIQHLLQAEQTDRGLRSIRYQMHVARFPIHRDLAGFDFSQSKVDRRQIDL